MVIAFFFHELNLCWRLEFVFQMWPGQRRFIFCDASCGNAAVDFSFENEYAFYSWILLPCKYKETVTGLFLLLEMEAMNGLNHRNTFLDHFAPQQQAIVHRILVEINRVMRGKWINSQTPLGMLQTAPIPLCSESLVYQENTLVPDTSLRVRKNVLVTIRNQQLGVKFCMQHPI